MCVCVCVFVRVCVCVCLCVFVYVLMRLRSCTQACVTTLASTLNFFCLVLLIDSLLIFCLFLLFFLKAIYYLVTADGFAVEAVHFAIALYYYGLLRQPAADRPSDARMFLYPLLVCARKHVCEFVSYLSYMPVCVHFAMSIVGCCASPLPLMRVLVYLQWL